MPWSAPGTCCPPPPSSRRGRLKHGEGVIRGKKEITNLRGLWSDENGLGRGSGPMYSAHARRGKWGHSLAMHVGKGGNCVLARGEPE